jgi:NAD(P)-dependent dehydrogenase (short-subunit alcohol dehydrogenase family)
MNKMQLQDKVVLITGALGAAGRSAAQMFLERGAIITACDIKSLDNFPEMDSLTQQYGEQRFTYIQADVTNEDQVKNIMEKTNRVFGRLDGSYHNAYVNNYRSIADQTLQEWEESIRGTLTSTFLVCKFAAQLMIQSGGGSIVNTSSVLGYIPKANNAGYGAGKAGLEQLTRIIAVEYAPYGIRANAVVPGDFKSEVVLANTTQKFKEKMKEISLIGRSGTTNEINEVAAFLLSDSSSYVTASLYPVTGGIYL